MPRTCYHCKNSIPPGTGRETPDGKLLCESCSPCFVECDDCYGYFHEKDMTSRNVSGNPRCKYCDSGTIPPPTMLSPPEQYPKDSVPVIQRPRQDSIKIPTKWKEIVKTWYRLNNKDIGMLKKGEFFIPKADDGDNNEGGKE